MWGLVVKSFADVILLTLAVHEAVSSSRMMRRLSLENFPITDHKAWHMKVSDLMVFLINKMYILLSFAVGNVLKPSELLRVSR